MPMKGFITTKEAADILGLSGGRIRAMIASGQIQGAEKFSGHIIPVKEIERLKQLKRKPGRPKGKTK